MSAGIYNFTIEQGASFALEVEYTDSNGDPIDLTGFFAEMQIASDYADNGSRQVYRNLTGNYYNSYATAAVNGISFTGAYNDYALEDGKIGIILYPGNTTDIGSSAGTTPCYYDLELYTTYNNTPSGTKTYSIRLLQGRIKISKEVTRYYN